MRAPALPLLAPALALALAGCGTSRPPEAGKLTLGCALCHGDPDRAGTDANGQVLAPAPPIDVTGATSSDAVGAHLVHLTSPRFSKAVTCDECHVVPSSSAHGNGIRDVAFGTLAHNVLPGDATRIVNPVWTQGTLSCSATYCHGNFKNGNDTNSPAWNGGQAAVTCGTCHGFPPKTVAQGGTHTAATNCASCHSKGGLSDTSHHVDGTVDMN